MQNIVSAQTVDSFITKTISSSRLTVQREPGEHIREELLRMLAQGGRVEYKAE